jgi:hypothetical protein
VIETKPQVSQVGTNELVYVRNDATRLDRDGGLFGGVSNEPDTRWQRGTIRWSGDPFQRGPFAENGSKLIAAGAKFMQQRSDFWEGGLGYQILYATLLKP